LSNVELISSGAIATMTAESPVIDSSSNVDVKSGKEDTNMI